MAKINLSIPAKQLFGQAMAEDLLQCSLLKTNLGVGEKAYQTFLGATAGHIQYIGLSLETQTTSIFFKTKNKVETENPLQFSIAEGETPKEISLWKAGTGVMDVGAVIPLTYPQQTKDNAFTVNVVDFEVKGDYE